MNANGKCNRSSGLENNNLSNFTKMNKEQNTSQTTQPAIAVDTVLGCVFVVNYDEAIIFNTNKDLHFYDETYHTFEQAKEQLVSYWDNTVSEAKRKLKEVKMYKLGNVQSMP